jgi:hypothetical protein
MSLAAIRLAVVTLFAVIALAPQAFAAVTVKTGTRPSYGATVKIEHGVRVTRAVPAPVPRRFFHPVSTVNAYVAHDDVTVVRSYGPGHRFVGHGHRLHHRHLHRRGHH